MVGIVARKYAKALFDLVLEDGGNTAGDSTVKEKLGVYMEGAKTVIALFGDGEFAAVIANPGIGDGEKLKLFKEAAAGVPEDFSALFALILRKERVTETPEVFEGFVELARAHLRLTTARVCSAKPLDEPRLENIKKTLEAKLNKTVEIETVVDDSLIAGLKISVDGREIDGTVKRGISNVRAAVYANA